MKGTGIAQTLGTRYRMSSQNKAQIDERQESALSIITLSTIPPRFRTLAPTLNSLLNQDAAIESIRLYIPRTYRRFPDYAGELPDVPEGVTIIRPDQDLGPASKVLFAAKELRGQDAQIIFCDDDKVFAPSWASKLLSEQAQRPDECVALFGKVIAPQLGKTGDGQPKAVRSKKNPFELRLRRLRHRIKSVFGDRSPRPQSYPIAKPGYADILQGLGGVVVRPSFFDDEAYEIPDAVWTVDDVWLSGMLARRGIRIWLPQGVEMPVTTEAHDIESLYKATIEGNRRRDANRLCIGYMQKTYGIWI